MKKSAPKKSAAKKSAAKKSAARKGAAQKGAAKKTTKSSSQRRQLTKPDTQGSEETVEIMEAVFEERGMPGEQAGDRARNAMKRIRTSKQTGKRIDAEPAIPGDEVDRIRPSSAKTVSAEQAAEEERERLEKPLDSGHGNYSPASPYRRKKGGNQAE